MRGDERVTELRGFKYIKLKSGRMLTYWDARTDADNAFTDLARAVSRMFKLAADDEYDLERLEGFIENLQIYSAHVLKEVEGARGVKTQEERIALLRNVTGRTPEEAREFLRKANELERAIADGA